ncbi:MAG TPA: hypothetical protein VF175_08335, partial [Lacipirellula sp.]
MQLELCVEDRDVLAELEKYAEGAEREEFALEALKIGVLALRRASTAFDGEFIQRETDRMIDSLQERLNSHAELAKTRLESALKSYFDPESGHFTQRVGELTTDNGGLARLMKEFCDGDSSKLAQTMVAYVGENAPLMKYLSPSQSDGLIAVLKKDVETQLQTQQLRILSEFSLDNPSGALNQMIERLTAKHGTLSKDLQEKIDEVIKEFSLDKPDSSLNRLVHKVNQAQQTITSEFSLDNEQSALRRLKNELTTILSAHVETNNRFQEEVKVALGKLVTRREEEARSTRHGATFQNAVYEFIDQYAQRRGDVAEDTSTKVGLSKNCKIGDAVICLGPDCAAAGAKIVVEAKEEMRFSLRMAQEEIEQARKNRAAQQGLFVFSQSTAPSLEPLARYGCDVFVVWDAEDPQTDAFLRAGLEISRALCLRSHEAAERQQINFEPIDRAILDIEKRVQNLDQVRKSAETIKSSSETILDRVRKDRDALEKQVTVLRDAMHCVKHVLGAEAPGQDGPAI